MQHPSRFFRSFLFMLLTAVLGVPVATAAQAQDEDQAELFLTAATDHEAAGHWMLAALAYEGSARLRMPDDPRRAEAFSASARAYYAGDFLEEAAEMSVRAGQAAEEVGDGALAAESFGHAASIYRGLGKTHLSQTMASRSCQDLGDPGIEWDRFISMRETLGCPR